MFCSGKLTVFSLFTRRFTSLSQQSQRVSVAVNGFCDPKFQNVRNTFEENFEKDLEDCASICIYHKGQPVVDLWASKNNNWQENSLAGVFSCTKGIVALGCQILVDRGQLDVTKPVSYYWTGFEKNGKEHIEVRHFLGHNAGLARLDKQENLPEDAALHWDVVIEAYENATPEYHPDEGVHGYHGLSIGYLAGEIIRRITGELPGAFFRREVADPLKIDFICGMKKETDFERIINLVQPDDEQQLIELVEALSYLGIKGFGGDLSIRDVQEAEIPSVNGFTNGRGLARMYGMLANGGELDGKRILSQETIERTNIIQTSGLDRTFGCDAAFGSGYMKCGLGPEEQSFGHAGGGGSLGFADPVNNISFGFVPTKMIYPGGGYWWVPAGHPRGDIRLGKLIDALYKDIQGLNS